MRRFGDVYSPRLTLRTVLRLTASLALVKLNYMRETPRTAFATSLLTGGSKNAKDKGTIRREDSDQTQKTLRDFMFGICFGVRIHWLRNPKTN